MATMDILLIPGFMLDADIFTDVRPGLERLGRVIDADTAHSASVGEMAARAVEKLDGPSIVVGFSMGGYVAREIVYRAPEKVRGLALVATSTRAVPARPAIQAGQFREVSRTAVERSLHPDHRTDDRIARVQQMGVRLGPDVYRRQAAMARQDDTRRLGEIRCPTLVVAAADDALRSIEESETLRDGIKGARMVVIPRCGHLVPMERPGELVDAIRTTFRTAWTYDVCGIGDRSE